jgi:cysteinyl-tRNA synthetase
MSQLAIYNSLSQSKEVFTPIEPGKIKFYVCGMTVYDLCHIGHARAMIVFDMVMRYLRFSDYEVTYVRNITDIDDKIIRRANENGEDIKSLTDRFILAMHDDFAAIGLNPPDQEPRATDHIPHIIRMIETLIDNGLAYVAGNGDVCYEVRKFKSYGELANRDLDKLRSGARIEVESTKRDPLDFVLWKLVKPDEPSWQSPWGEGRPGWHIECSAMSADSLGNHFDIHGGGMDLKFPHHENEIAQSEGAAGCKFVNTWMHAGFLQINKEKMSKSLGNFLTIRDTLKECLAEVLRFFMLSTHYRKPINYSDEALDQAKSSLESLYTALRDVSLGVLDEEHDYVVRFKAAMNDDFNTPEAMAVLFELAKEINTCKSSGASKAQSLAAILKYLGNAIGVLVDDAQTFLQQGLVNVDADKVEALIVARKQARADKNWAESDRVRDELKAMGVVVEDSASGTTWRVE